MTIDEAIQHCEEVAEENEEIYEAHCRIYSKEVVERYPSPPCKKCAEEHRQLAEWLKELKAYKKNTCGDAISRQAMLDILDDMVKNYVNENDFDKAQGIAWVKVQRLPSVTPQQKTGHWIIIDDCEQFIAKCSKCGRIEDSRMINNYPYCHCGTKMEVEE